MTWGWDADGTVLLGQPVVRLRLSSDQPRTSVSLKLCDVFPDGTSALVTRGSLVLDHLEPGQVHDVEVELDACAYAFDPGQTMRLSFAGSDWPNTVAPPTPATLTVHGGELELPTWSGPSPYAPPEFTPGAPTSAEEPDGVVWRMEQDVLRRTTSAVVDHGGTFASSYDGEATEHYRGRVSVDNQTFAQRAEAEASYELRWPGIRVTSRSVLDVRVGADAYDVSITLEAREGEDDGVLIGERRWDVRLPR